MLNIVSENHREHLKLWMLSPESTEELLSLWKAVNESAVSIRGSENQVLTELGSCSQSLLGLGSPIVLRIDTPWCPETLILGGPIYETSQSYAHLLGPSAVLSPSGK